MFSRKSIKNIIKYYVAFKKNKRDLGIFAEMVSTVYCSLSFKKFRL